MPGKYLRVSTKEKIESIEIAADNLAVPFSNRFCMSQRQRRKEFARSTVADSRVVFERGERIENPIVTGRYPANPKPGEAVSLRHDTQRYGSVVHISEGGKAIGWIELQSSVNLIRKNNETMPIGEHGQLVHKLRRGQKSGRIMRKIDNHYLRAVSKCALQVFEVEFPRAFRIHLPSVTSAPTPAPPLREIGNRARARRRDPPGLGPHS